MKTTGTRALVKHLLTTLPREGRFTVRTTRKNGSFQERQFTVAMEAVDEYIVAMLSRNAVDLYIEAAPLGKRRRGAQVRVCSTKSEDGTDTSEERRMQFRLIRGGKQ